MNCFYDDNMAAGVCKNCQRGLCKQCAVAFPDGLACRGRCEAVVEGISAVIAQSIQVHRKAINSKNLAFLAYFFTGLGLFGALCGVVGLVRQNSDKNMAGLFGSSFVVLCLGLHYWRMKRSLYKDAS